MKTETLLPGAEPRTGAPAPVTPRPRGIPAARPRRVGLRLLLSPVFGRGTFDGAWWPQSRDLETELPDLVDHFPPAAGRIDRVVYSPPDWLPAPRRIRAARGPLKAGAYPEDDTHVMLLGMSTRRILQLMVVPPGTPAAVALRAMATAATPTDAGPAADVLAASARWVAARSAALRWVDDGGTWR